MQEGNDGNRQRKDKDRMSVKNEWQEDSEAMSIAMDVVDKYNETFDGIDLTKIRFVRVMGKKNGKACRVLSVGFPYNIDVPYLYYMEIDDGKWKAMTDVQRNILVFRGLFEIAPGGMDSESVNYGKKRKKDVEDFTEVIAVAGGRYDWDVAGATGIHDILTDKDKENIEGMLKE